MEFALASVHYMCAVHSNRYILKSTHTHTHIYFACVSWCTKVPQQTESKRGKKKYIKTMHKIIQRKRILWLFINCCHTTHTQARWQTRQQHIKSTTITKKKCTHKQNIHIQHIKCTWMHCIHAAHSCNIFKL